VLKQKLVGELDLMSHEQFFERGELRLYASLIERQGVRKAVDRCPCQRADDQENSDDSPYNEQYRDDGRNAFPFKPKERRRPDDGKENRDKEGHQN
jgi:hypothetical protein